jgi:GGDEF domain-containing protein
MKSVRLGDLRELLHGSAFSNWWTEYRRAMSTLKDASLRHEDLVSQSETMLVRSELAQRAAVDAFSRAGDEDDEGTRSASEAQTLENRALELVGEYEEQRIRTSELWVRLGGAERAIEERRDGSRKGASHEGAKARSADAALRVAERTHQELREHYEAEDKKRTRLWEQVEAAWASSFERALLVAEHATAARRIRREAERLFEEAEERRARAKQLASEAEAAGRERAEAERARVALFAEARARFGCATGDAFLYWRHADDKRAAYAVALADDPDGANLEVKALGIYTVGRQRGIQLLEPAREGLGLVAMEDDRRFEEYFLGPRKGARRDGGA